MSLYDNVRAILVAPEWEPVNVIDYGAFVTIAGRFNGVAHAGSRADWEGLARDLDRIARERHEAGKAEAKPEPAAEPAPPAVDPRDAELAALRARIAELESSNHIDLSERPIEEVVGPLAALKAKIDAVRAGQQELTPDELLQMYRDDPPGAAAKLEDAVRALKGEARRKLSELLNVELAELKNLRGMAGEDREREQQIEYLLGLFTRLGEI